MKDTYVLQGYDFRRIHERKKYDTEIVFSHSDRIDRGIINNISLGGAFIETPKTKHCSIGDVVTVSIPYSTGHKNIKRKGQIKWMNNRGFAIEFI